MKPGQDDLGNRCEREKIAGLVDELADSMTATIGRMVFQIGMKIGVIAQFGHRLVNSLLYRHVSAA